MPFKAIFIFFNSKSQDYIHVGEINNLNVSLKIKAYLQIGNIKCVLHDL